MIHRTATTDDKKLQSSLKKLSVNTIPGIEEVSIKRDDVTNKFLEQLVPVYLDI